MIHIAMDILTLIISIIVVAAYLFYRSQKPTKPGQCRTFGSCASCSMSGTCHVARQKLDTLSKGDRFRIMNTDDEIIRSQLIRLGIDPNQPLYCDYVFSKGPIVVKRGKQQIALGRDLAKQITVERLSS